MELEKNYNFTDAEAKIYKLWEESGFFNPDNLPGDRSEPFSIVLPPPNVTGILHMGSALMIAIQDILVRYQRMQGKKTLWIPGTDSAAIATQAKVEKELQKKEGKNRHDLGREELLKRIEAFVEENKSAILEQIRAMGASVDWSRYAYTMDDQRYHAVMTAFVRMYNAGLIYRGNRIVNWDPRGQTVISDDEIEYEERDATLYTFKYWPSFPISIATTRPETKVGDTAVAVHPDDPRYQQYIGQEFTGDFAGTSLTIRIVADNSVEKDFGTGALGVTPAHSYADAEIAERNQLPSIQVINELAKMTEAAGPLVAGLKVAEAREKIVAWLRDNNLIEKEETIKQNVATAERTGGIVEPLPKLQWFVSVTKEFALPHSEIPGITSGESTTLKKIMQASVDSGETRMVPERFEKTYRYWVNNLRDWCISRQIWFGHRIPVWYRGDEIYCGVTAPSGEGWSQDADVLDTWFSSSLWTFSTLGWPGETKDLKEFYPTTVLETGYDIIPLWVSRMIMMSGFHLGQVPFHTVYLHGLVRDEKGRKISKSLGNNIDPVAMIAKYGTDAVRMSLIIGTSAGNDSRISEDKIKGYKHFANKIWNASRFVLMNLEGFDDGSQPELTASDAQLITELNALIADVTKDIDEYRFYLAGEKLYHYFWHTFADKIIEDSKPALNGDEASARASAQYTLLHILTTCLKLLHPFMPFVTEELWSHMPIANKQLLIVENWPSGN